MKTSNKLLLAVYLFIIILIFSSFANVIINTEDHKPTHSNRKTLIIKDEIDSLFLNVNEYANAQIKGGDSLLIKYIDNYQSKTIGKSLYIDVKSSVVVKIPESVIYISVFAKKCDLYDIKRDSLTISAIGLAPSFIRNSQINHLKLILNSSKVGFINTETETLDVKLKNNSRLYDTEVND